MYAQKTPKLDLCDVLASHPDDTGKIGKGVADSEIKSAQAIPKCELAAKRTPQNGRFHFQLGRAYWAAKRYDAAVGALLKAEELSYTPAYYYLGKAYEEGLITGEKADANTAREFYLLAAAEKFAPAELAYSEMVGVVPEYSEFKQPAFMKALYEGDMDFLRKNKRKTLFYLQGIQSFMELSPNEYDESCTELANQSASSVIDSRMLSEFYEVKTMLPTIADLFGMVAKMVQNNGADIAEAAALAPVSEDGLNDIYLLVYDYGSCKGPAAQKVYGSLTKYLGRSGQ